MNTPSLAAPGTFQPGSGARPSRTILAVHRAAFVFAAAAMPDVFNLNSIEYEGNGLWYYTEDKGPIRPIEPGERPILAAFYGCNFTGCYSDLERFERIVKLVDGFLASDRIDHYVDNVGLNHRPAEYSEAQLEMLFERNAGTPWEANVDFGGGAVPIIP